MLAHFDIPLTEPAGWGLRIEGAVTRPRTIDLAELQSAQSVTVPVTIECAGNGRADLQPRPIGQPWLGGAVSTAAWTGTRLWPLLDAAGVHPAAVEVAFRGRDHGRDGVVPLAYERSLTVAECQSSGALLAWAMNGRPLDAVHGAPLRLIVPGWYGMASVKWLEAITILDEPFNGTFQAADYRLVTSPDGQGPAVTRMLPRALIQPPGLPDVETGARSVAAGFVQLAGRAWSGFGAISSVEVSVDGGVTWHPAELAEPLAATAWTSWTTPWEAAPGRHTLSARATDETGRSQPLEPAWNLWGYANNAVQRLPVMVFANAAHS